MIVLERSTPVYIGMRNSCKEVEERSYVVNSKQAAVSRGRTAAYRRRRCTSRKILEGSTNFCLLFCSCFPSPCCSWLTLNSLNHYRHSLPQAHPQQATPKQVNPLQANLQQDNPQQVNPLQANLQQDNPQQVNPLQANLQQANLQQANPP
ncbi:hypothetical protein LAZ67_6003013 [Cordylochernes scorpioides]|uniref:Uncharacterized protein n=1 Tax=Cordylochernes scorpioides TaxID=51811 RepID=A0ABY6KKM7_9ARAC|nr:hypothetical protein LAZ67_6003013 [Cordylochernes scorpioides]